MRKNKTISRFLLTCAILTMMTDATLAQESMVSGYMAQLNNTEAPARAYAAYALSQIGSVEAVDSLIPLLNDEDKYVRAIVAEALGRIGDTRAVEALTTTLQDKERSVRWSAANALKQINPSKQYEIVRYVEDLKDPDALVRLQAAAKLSELVPEKSQQYQMTQYINDLADSDARVRASAANALGTIGDATAVQPLITAINDNDVLVRKNSVTALGQIALRLKDDTVVKPVIELFVALLQDKSTMVSASAAAALAEIGEPTVESLVNAIDGDNAMVRAIAVDILGKIHPEHLQEYQISRYIKDLKDQNVSTRANAAIALASIRDERAIEPLISALEDVDSGVRQNATNTLIMVGEPAIGPLIPLLKSQNSSVQLNAAIALREIGFKLEDGSKLNPAKDVVIAAFIDTASPIHSIAEQILKKIGANVVGSLTMMLSDEDDTTRAMAAAMLAEIQPKKANYYQTMRYMNDLKSVNAAVRSAAAGTLGMFGEASAVGRLITLLGDDDYSVKKSAANALVQIGAPAIEPLIAALTDKNQDRRRYAFTTLADIAPKAKAANLQPAITPALDGLRDFDSSIRSAAATMLIYIGELAVNPLYSLFEDPDSSIHSIVTRILIQIGSPAIEPLEMALNDENSVVRNNAVVALTQIAPYRAGQYQITRYINDLKDADTTIRAVAAFNLGRVNDSRAVEPLIAALSDKDFRVRANAADSLAYLADKRAIEPLKRVENDDKVEMVKRVAKQSLERLNRLP
ncbi:HEAT repeat domain-containing protein [Candidatus Poribacteria bacterium]|nr:HEAT repeat domain-containing protein [Candidatus Poribacteria bacterium]